MKNKKSLFQKFIRRIGSGQIINTLYLSYYYSLLKIYDLMYSTNFCNSQTPDEYDSVYRAGSTGNFPAHPNIVKKMLQAYHLPKDIRIIDVGHGSGLPLHVASKLGFSNLTGVEHGYYPYMLSKENLKPSIHLIHGDAFDIDYTEYELLFFFSPFRGELAKKFFEEIPENIVFIITVNHDRIIEEVLLRRKYNEIFNYQHLVYLNFNGKVWKKE